VLTAQENALLTQVGPGTPCGALMRRYWQPAALSEELPPGGPPLPLRLLGEDLVLFRNEAGRPALLGLHCSHRGADLSYGRLEDGGLRCIYHGWLYDPAGHCLEQPGEPAGSTFHQRIAHRAYPCQEAGGLVLAYLGPDEPPLIPAYEFLQAPEDYRFTGKIFQECNFLQAVEGNLDPVHVPFLHQIFRRAGADAPRAVRPVRLAMDVEETDFGVRVMRVDQNGPDRIHARSTHFVLPNLCPIPAGSTDGYTVNWHVPIDDATHWKYVLQFKRTEPLDVASLRNERNELDAGYRLLRNPGNRYLQDRDEMRADTFAGLGTGFQAQDALATESQGPIQDRTSEHLGWSDRGILLIRQSLKKAIETVAAGDEPPLVIRSSAENQLARIGPTAHFIPASADWREVLRQQIDSAVSTTSD
jgi:phenylpropionate dioxygenase-like ring-hydroxylating dioxygenase large terminal subunit